jgi:hypothetical protein
MVWSNDANCYVGWTPVTKLHFETFLCDDPGEAFNGAFYDAVLATSPTTSRVHVGGVKSENYWQAFVTALRPDEARAYSQWCGDTYQLPPHDIWLKVYDEFKTRPAIDLAAVLNSVSPSARTKELYTNLNAAADAAFRRVNGDKHKWTLADQTFIRNGVFEWVYTTAVGNRIDWVGLGQPAMGLSPPLFSLENKKPHPVKDPATIRNPLYGFRLFQRVN